MTDTRQVLEARNDERAKVIAEVAAWLRTKAIKAWGADTAGTYLNEYAATALETGEWKR